VTRYLIVMIVTICSYGVASVKRRLGNDDVSFQ